MRLKFYNHFYKTILIILTVLFSFGGYSQPLNCSNTTKLVKLLSEKHVQPRQINDSFSQDVFNLFLDQLDSRNLYLTKDDIISLRKHELKIDDYINNEDCSFLHEISSIYESRLRKSEVLIDEYLSDKPNYYADEEISMYKNSDLKLRTEDEQKSLWHRYLKYKILENLFTVDTNILPSVKSSLEKEENVRLEIKNDYKRQFKRFFDYKGGMKNLVYFHYNNSIAQVFDPHSQYFDAEDIEGFQESLSREVSSFGIEISENMNDEIIISGLIPGSTAWSSKEFNTNDVILKIKPEQKDEISLLGWKVKDLLIELNDSEIQEVEFTVKKSNGHVKSIVLKKDKITSDENIVKSFILNGEEKVAYISLPGFYTDWQFADGRQDGCAQDLAKDLFRLQNENIDGLILDLRGNGGGSMYEAINIAGTFIDWGSLFVVNYKGEEPVLKRDMNRGVSYSGPLLVMVDGYSASASEVLSGTLQDYNRALIVGTPTFGKSTAQTLFNLDGSFYSNPNNKPVAKITTQKMYRVTKETHQWKGVIPDIELPDITKFADEKERKYPHAIKPDRIEKKIYYTSLQKLPKDSLEKRSKHRLNNDKKLQKVVELCDDYEQYTSKNKIRVSLKIDEFRSYMQDNLKWDRYDDLFDKESDHFKVQNNKYNQELIGSDEYYKSLNNKIIENISKDVYIEESYNIMLDLIKLQND